MTEKEIAFHEEKVLLSRNGSRRQFLHRRCARLAVMFLSILILWSGTGINSLGNELEKSIKAKEDAIKQAQEQKKQLQSGLSDIKAMVNSLQNSMNDLQSYVEQLDGNLDAVQSRINELKAMIEEKEKEIADTQAELDAAIVREEAQYESMKIRIQYMYERGSSGYLDILLTSRSLGDLLNRAEYVRQLADYDQNQLEEYKQNRQYVETCKLALQEEQEVLTQAKAEVEVEEKGLEQLIAVKEQQITAFEGDINNKESAIDEYEEDIKQQNDTIAALEAAVAEEKRQLEAQNKKAQSYDGGMFQFPAPSYKRVSDDFGNRIHPTLGIQKFHNGVDLAAPSGSPILAAYNGTVVGASYNSSMGNYVMINHGDGLYTIYMHASALYVSNGQSVTKGQQIAAVGSTGRSTGPHLHFSVRLNGQYVNPWNYLK